MYGNVYGYVYGNVYGYVYEYGAQQSAYVLPLACTQLGDFENFSPNSG